jgi:hypothetical protein
VEAARRVRRQQGGGQTTTKNMTKKATVTLQKICLNVQHPFL